MAYLIGTDEAGYGPNLGPLVITATVWRVNDSRVVDSAASSNGQKAQNGTGRLESDPHDLYRRLKSVICRNPSKAHPRRRLAVADSKALYHSGQGIELLERGVLALLSLVAELPCAWREIWPLLDCDAASHLDTLPWHVSYQAPLPWMADAEDLVEIGRKLRKGFAAAGVQLVAVRSAVVFPERFNAWNERHGNKAETLSRLTLGLVEQSLADCQGEPVHIVCDRHGGRKNYGRLLQEQFPDPLVEVYREAADESIYRWGQSDQRVEIRFRVGGEAFLPAALASMVSKYLRELSMRAFNDFWSGHVPELQPTAGYSTDARRFKRAIADAQSQLGIDDLVLWRAR